MHYFFPGLSSQINFSKNVRFLDKEYQKLFADWEKKGWTAGDKLLEYQLKGGGKHLVLVHAEAHGGDQAIFKEQQFIRFYRIRDKHPDKMLTQLVIYTGKTMPPEPGTYHYSFEGTINMHQFNTCTVKEQDRQALERRGKENPFALVMLAALEHIETLDDGERRRKTKIRLIRLCLESPFRKMIGDLLTFVQFTIALPEKEEDLYREEVETILKQPKMGMRDVQPEATKTLEIMLWGKTLEQRDEEMKERLTKQIESKLSKQIESKLTKQIELKKQTEFILKMYNSGMEPAKIASILKVKKATVLKAIEGVNQQPE